MNEHEYAGLTRKLVDTAIDWKARAEAAEAKLALLSNVRRWSYYPIEMPVTSEGYGPASYKEADRITYEVWDHLLCSRDRFDNLPDAINEAIRLTLEQICRDGGTDLAELKSTHETGPLSDSYGPIAGGDT